MARRNSHFISKLKAGTDEDAIGEEDARRFVYEGWGKELPIEILSRTGWHAGFTLVANHMQKGRVFIGGDAAHLFTPAGGMGYNTAIEDAVNLGWKLAAVVRGHGGDALLHSYETERRAIAVRNTGFGAGFADSLGNFVATPGTGNGYARGCRSAPHSRRILQSACTGGVQYSRLHAGSALRWLAGHCQRRHETAARRPEYLSPHGVPWRSGPHMWLEDGSSLYDHFGFEWTLLRVGPADTAAIEAAAIKASLPLKVLDLPNPDLRDLYKRMQR